MIKSIRELITGKKPDSVECEVLQSCLIEGIHRSTGSKVFLSFEDASYLESMGRVQIKPDPAHQAKIEAFKKSIPEIPAPADAPASYSAMPKCFTELWNITQKIGVLIRHEKELTTLYLRGRALTEDEQKYFNEFTTNTQTRADSIDNLIKTKTPNFAFLNEEQMEQIMKIRRELVRAGERLDRAREQYRENKIRLQFECSKAIIEITSDATKHQRNASQTARELFQLRIAALGLHQSQVDRLYAGSALAVKYDRFKPVVHDRKQAWHDGETGEQAFFISGDIDALSSQYAQQKRNHDELAALAKEASAESERAKKAA